MRSGTTFDIREFTIHDGPGLRTTVFLKGCPLRCGWCHNPEGRTPGCEAVNFASGRRIVGERYTSAGLAGLLNRQAELLRAGEGGVTFSGGEPLFQAAFVAEVIEQLDGLHVLLDTSGYGDEADFRWLAQRVDLVYFDLKLMDPELHCRYTGQSNSPILRNLQQLGQMGVPCVLRVPLVPGVTDTDENLAAIAEAAAGVPGLLRVELLGYNRAAGGKYAACGLDYRPEWDESQPVRGETRPFEKLSVPVMVHY